MESPERNEAERNEDEGTSPDEPIHEATTPPANPETDGEALEEGSERLEQAGGGH